MAQSSIKKPAAAKKKTAAKMKSKPAVKHKVLRRKAAAGAQAKKDPTAAMLRAAHDNMSGLHKLGLIDKQTMSEFDEMCLPKVDVLVAGEIRELREAQNVSQSVFAAYLNTTKSTVSKWEQGDKKPNGIAQRLLNIIRDKGLSVIS